MLLLASFFRSLVELPQKNSNKKTDQKFTLSLQGLCFLSVKHLLLSMFCCLYIFVLDLSHHTQISKTAKKNPNHMSAWLSRCKSSLYILMFFTQPPLTHFNTFMTKNQQSNKHWIGNKTTYWIRKRYDDGVFSQFLF